MGTCVWHYSLYLFTGGSVRFNYSNFIYNNYEHSYANLYCTGDIDEGNCTYDVVDDCNHLVIECYIGIYMYMYKYDNGAYTHTTL